MQASITKEYGEKKNVPDCKDGKTFPPKKGL